MNNYKDATLGKRIRLLSPMFNEGSKLIPVEDIPTGTEGTIVYIQINKHDYDQIGVNWDNGSTLSILPYKDNYEIYESGRCFKSAN